MVSTVLSCQISQKKENKWGGAGLTLGSALGSLLAGSGRPYGVFISSLGLSFVKQVSYLLYYISDFKFTVLFMYLISLVKEIT